MGTRTKSSRRCPRCLVLQELCFCADLPRLETRTRVVVLMHHREEGKPSNTGRLAELCLANAEVRIRGDHTRPMSREGLEDPTREMLLLYPSEDATELSVDFVRGLERPVTLLVPDGNWGQASKVRKRDPAAKAARAVKLPMESPSRYRLRREHLAEGLATFEAIARAMGYLEGPDTRARLEAAFLTMVERVLLARGQRRDPNA